LDASFTYLYHSSKDSLEHYNKKASRAIGTLLICNNTKCSLLFK